MSKDLYEMCEKFNENSDFSELIKMAVVDVPWISKTFQEEFEVVDSVVRRWASGVAKPLPIVRKQIVGVILRELNKMKENV